MASKYLQKSLIAIIRWYQFAFSLLFGHCCRFEPSCSCYAIEAIKGYGILKGGYLSIRRLLRCHPWHPGGMDLVPNRGTNNRSRIC